MQINDYINLSEENSLSKTKIFVKKICVSSENQLC